MNNGYEYTPRYRKNDRKKTNPIQKNATAPAPAPSVKSTTEESHTNSEDHKIGYNHSGYLPLRHVGTFLHAYASFEVGHWVV